MKLSTVVVLALSLATASVVQGAPLNMNSKAAALHTAADSTPSSSSATASSTQHKSHKHGSHHSSKHIPEAQIGRTGGASGVVPDTKSESTAAAYGAGDGTGTYGANKNPFAVLGKAQAQQSGSESEQGTKKGDTFGLDSPFLMGGHKNGGGAASESSDKHASKSGSSQPTMAPNANVNVPEPEELQSKANAQLASMFKHGQFGSLNPKASRSLSKAIASATKADQAAASGSGSSTGKSSSTQSGSSKPSSASGLSLIHI